MARILMVDDELMVREVACDILSRAGHQVTCASGAEEALALLYAEPFDLMITDLTMPGIDGLTLARSAARTSDRPVLFISGGEAPPDLGRRMRFLRKPFNVSGLVKDVEALLSGE